MSYIAQPCCQYQNSMKMFLIQKDNMHMLLSNDDVGGWEMGERRGEHKCFFRM